MIISIASGKGGTGKTTVAVNLALTVNNMNKKVTLIDCDVDSPNVKLFLKTDPDKEQDIYIMKPVINKNKCSYCGKCQEVCHFNAIAVIKKLKQVLVFNDLCHGCGVCSYFCPSNAIKENKYKIGVKTISEFEKISFISGELRIGETLTPPIIKKLKHKIKRNTLTIIDSAPGTSCSVINSIEGSDYVLLVTEPTPFGLYDLKLAYTLVKKLNLKAGVIINKAEKNNKIIADFCKKEKIKILAEIPYDREAAVLYSYGLALILETRYEKIFKKLYKEIMNNVKKN